MQFFKEAVTVPRFPRDILEGAIKGFLAGGIILSLYDCASPIPNNSADMMSHSQTIVRGYEVCVLLGALCGFIGQIYLEDRMRENDQPQAHFR
ncbi:MAG: hypothetical protein H0U75_10295 [Legionella sp.]|nr:hypothetical protein [Legionella sp.]